jgi:TRAP-type C4-dicarboxylate transport system permease small subunit
VLVACWRFLDLGLKSIMAIFLFAMMVITSVDVAGRYLFNAPLSGGYEIVQYLMALVVFAALPVTTAADSHLSVTLIPPNLSGRIGRAHRIVVGLVSMLALMLIAWRMAEQAQILSRSQQISGYLQLPLAPIAWVMAAFAALAVVIIAVKFAATVLGRDTGLREREPAPLGID